ncbi:hypothetical protein HOI83_02580 [Candidatus Uhrbacteria bacterium]|jgi:hypothetical protein|nr:hypothetical protein [Candidatus Uhrbacteria bacterium]
MAVRPETGPTLKLGGGIRVGVVPVRITRGGRLLMGLVKNEVRGFGVAVEDMWSVGDPVDTAHSVLRNVLAGGGVGCYIGEPTYVPRSARLTGDEGDEGSLAFGILYIVPVSFLNERNDKGLVWVRPYSPELKNAGIETWRLMQVLQGRYTVDKSAFLAQFVRNNWTMTEARNLVDEVFGSELDRSNFRKLILRMVRDGEALALDEERPTATRPARLYRFTFDIPGRPKRE